MGRYSIGAAGRLGVRLSDLLEQTEVFKIGTTSPVNRLINRAGAKTAEWAGRGYGVEMAGNQIDDSATRDLRNQMRGERIARVDSNDAGGRPEALSRAELRCRRCDALVPAEKTLIQTEQLQGLGRFVLSLRLRKNFSARKKSFVMSAEVYSK